MLQSYTIDDDLTAAERGAVEVTVTLSDGRRRWCFFMTPAALANAGDWVPGTRTRYHLGELHMIIAAELTPEVIDRVIGELAATGQLERRTLPLD